MRFVVTMLCFAVIGYVVGALLVYGGVIRAYGIDGALRVALAFTLVGAVVGGWISSLGKAK